MRPLLQRLLPSLASTVIGMSSLPFASSAGTSVAAGGFEAGRDLASLNLLQDSVGLLDVSACL